MKKWTLITIVLALGLGACTAKKRDQVWSQNQGENAEAVSSYDGKLINIETQGEIAGKTSSTSSALQGKTNLAAKNLGTYDMKFVSFTPKNTLLKEAPFKARSNTSGKYQLLYKVTDNFLKIYKVAAEEDIAFDEKTYADRTLVAGKLAIPMMGYPVKEFFNQDVQKNDNEENTNKLIEKKAVGKSSAQFFRFDANGAVMFEAMEKTNIFPKELFAGQAKDGSDNDWFYAETTIATAQDKQTEIGSDASTDQQLQPSNRVKFVLNEGMLKIVNMSIDERLKLSDDVNFSTTLIIPIEWKAFRVKTKGQDTEMSESEDKETHWSQRPYLKLDFDKSKPVRLNRSGYYFEENSFSKVTEVELSDDYFSFTVQKHDSNTRIRYSFWRVSAQKVESTAAAHGVEYQPRNYFRDDMTKYGFFKTTKSSVTNYEIRRREDQMKNVFISRFHPEREIKFYFTDSTPKCTEADHKDGSCLRDWASKSIENWNKAFENAGTKVTVVLDSDEKNDKKLGDVRYNTINLIDSLIESNLFGFGPSIANPYTGEIISATTNVHVTPIRSSIVDEISNYIRMRKGDLAKAYYFQQDSMKSLGISTSIEPQINDVDGPSRSEKSNIFLSGLQNLTGFKIPSIDPKTYKIDFKVLDFKAEKNHNYGREFDLSLSSSNIHAEIKSKCGEVETYINKIIADKVDYEANEKSILVSCANKLLGPHLLGTLVHELGHNFGFRHNFRASSDWENFYPVEKNDGVTSRSSSVMEYTSFNENRLTKPGYYDVAALKFAYAGKVELGKERNQELKLDTSKSIDDNLGSQRSTAHRYFYCTDEDTDLAVDPLCRRFDAGVTPKDIVQNLIKEYNTEVATLNNRFDKIYGIYYDGTAMDRLNKSRLARYYLPMFSMYGEWRSQVAQFVGFENRYLENFTEAEYEAKMISMNADPKFGPYYRAYRPAIDMIFKFMKSIAALPVKSCVAETKKGVLELVELERLRDKSFFMKTVTVKSCTDDLVQTAMKDAGRTPLLIEKDGKLVVPEIGFMYQNIRYNTSSENAAREPLDVIGSLGDRALAIAAIAARASPSTVLQARGFEPGFLDEPKYRREWIEFVTDRLTKGVDRSSLSSDLAAVVGADAGELPIRIPQFKTEKDLLNKMISSLKEGIKVPNNTLVSDKRVLEFSGFITSREEILKQAVIKTPLQNGKFYVVLEKDAKYAIDIANRFNVVTALRRGPVKVTEISDALIQYVKSLTEQAPDKMSMNDVRNILNGISEKLDQVTKTNEDVKFFSPLFVSMSKAYQAAMGQAQRIHATEIEKQMPAELMAKLKAQQELSAEEGKVVLSVFSQIFANDSFLELYKMAKAESLFPSKANLVQLLEKAKDTPAPQYAPAEDVQTYQDAKEDIDAQYDLLMTLMKEAPTL